MKKILIVDYDQNSLSNLQGIFAGQGYQVVTAADGQTGWDKYNKESPDLVLMEAMLPKVHGFELCQRITSERNSQATVFIMTGVYKDRVYRTEALRTYGASEYFEKPLKMAELLASVEAVLGRPEPRPAEPRPVEARPAAEPPASARPFREVCPEPAPAEPRRREKPKSDDSIFSLPDDLDRLSREIPKARKPAPAHHEPAAKPRLEALADELLRKVMVESTTKTVHAKPAGGNGNGNGNGNAGDIDNFLKTALAGLDLEKEKVKVPRTAPLPPAPPVEEESVPTASKAATPEPRPTPDPETADDRSFAGPAVTEIKNTLTPGDPGSDISPFFTPEKPKPVKPAEKIEKKVSPAPEPVRHDAPSRPEPAKHEPKPQPAAHEPFPHEPVRHEPAKHEPLLHEQKRREANVIAATDIFQEIAEPKEKKGFPKLVIFGIGVIAVTAVGFILLRPKPPAPAKAEPRQVDQTLNQRDVPAQPVEEPRAPVVKPAPAKQKAQPQAKPADPGPSGAEAILPTSSPTSALNLPASSLGSGSGTNQAAPGSNPDPQSTKTAEPPASTAKTETTPPQNQATDPGTATAPDAGSGVTVAAPVEPPVNEGALVELSAVTEPPKLIKSVDPVYPQTAQRLGRGGNITVNALIDEKGNVIDTGILKGIQDDKGLGKAAETAVKKWKFQPARKNGVAVKVWKSFVIAFKAEANPAK